MVTMMFWYGAGWLWWQVTLMWVGMLAFWGLLIWGIYALVTGAARRPGDGHNSDSGEARRGGGAFEILDERLARGEIDAAEYQRLRGLITSGDRQARTEADDDANAPAGSGSRR
jgi:uncharacterized membrane protein